MKYLACLLLLSSVPAVSSGMEAHNSVRIRGNASITIDGNLADWNSAPVAPLRFVHPRDAGRFAEVRFISDSASVYIGGEIHGGGGEAPARSAGLSARGGAIELIFYGGRSYSGLVNRSYRGIDGRLVITSDATGATILEGAVPPQAVRTTTELVTYPYLLQNLGAAGAISPLRDGYTFEVALPLSLLQWAPGEIPPDLQIAIRVLDADDALAFGWPQRFRPSLATHEALNRIHFQDSGISAQAPPQSQLLGESGLPAMVSEALQRIFADDAPAAAALLFEAAGGHRRNEPRGSKRRGRSTEIPHSKTLHAAGGEIAMNATRRWTLQIIGGACAVAAGFAQTTKPPAPQPPEYVVYGLHNGSGLLRLHILLATRGRSVDRRHERLRQRLLLGCRQTWQRVLRRNGPLS
jgi:hypothetical protein